MNKIAQESFDDVAARIKKHYATLNYAIKKDCNYLCHSNTKIDRDKYKASLHEMFRIKAHYENFYWDIL